MIHIVFQEADINVLKKAIELDENLTGEVSIIRDDFAVGPLVNIETEEGWKRREDWWRELVQYSPYSDDLVGSFDDKKTVEKIKESLEQNTNEKVWIWMGQNQHDVCGYYWLLPQLQKFAGKVFVLYLNNLPFISEKGQLFYPTALHQIQPKEFLKAKKLNRAITLSEFEVDSDEWKRLSTENKPIRILEGGKKIIGKDDDFFDNDLLGTLTKEPQKGNRYFHNLFSKLKIKTGDIFLLWRLKTLAEKGLVEILGEPSKGWKDFEVKLKINAAEVLESNPIT